MLYDLPIDSAYSVALARWQSPFPGFTSGHDPRTSDNALGSLPRPEPEYGDPAQQALICRLVDESDWWTRRLFDELLRQIVGSSDEAQQKMFGCDDRGSR